MDEVHNQWHYLNYMDYITKKNKASPKSMTLEEIYIHNLVINKDAEQEWFPCYEKRKKVDDPIDNLEEKLTKTLNELSKNVLSKLEEISSKLKEEAK